MKRASYFDERVRCTQVCSSWQGVVVITSTHAIIYADDAERARTFLRDVLELPYVDAHDGWLIFRLPPPSSEFTPRVRPEIPGRARRAVITSCS